MTTATPGALSHSDPEAHAAEDDPGVVLPTAPVAPVPVEAAPVEATPVDAMPTLRPGDEALKALLKEAVGEALREQRSLIQSVVEDALEEMAFAEALREVEAHERRFSRRAGFRAVEGEA